MKAIIQYATSGMGFLLPSFVRFYLRRNSERTACLIIDVAEYMDAKHCREIADYLTELSRWKEREE